MTAPLKSSDLATRTVSALVMVVVAGTALWLGGWAWTLFVVFVAMAVLLEWRSLVRGFVNRPLGQLGWTTGGVLYIGLSAATLLYLRHLGIWEALMVAAGVIATDIGGYAFGRTFGGPKIAPAISPSKTWAGLMGGMSGAAGALVAIEFFRLRHVLSLEGGCALAGTCPTLADQALPLVLSGFALAIIAQAGDFFESWMKRRAGVKDSSRLIPGHGGVFDRVDGLLAVLFVIGLASLWAPR